MDTGKKEFKRSLLRVATAGSVDDGKSTLLGRLLIDSKNIYADQVKNSSEETEYLAHITDGLRSEREQGITIDVAYRYLSTKSRRVILADTPGHEQYTRNMATGASNADVAIVLVDAQKGISTQTKRHAFITSLMGVPHIILAVNKMDLINFDQNKYEAIKTEFLDFAAKLNVADIRAIPMSALLGDNVFNLSKKTPWYNGETLYDYLDNIYVDADKNRIDFRFPVQLPLKVDNRRLFAGQVSSGSVAVGEDVLMLPSYRTSKVKAIINIDNTGKENKLEAADTAQSVAIELEDQLDVERGSMIVRKNNVPQIENDIEALIVWMDVDNCDTSKNLNLQHTTRLTKCKITDLSYKIDVNTLKRTEAKDLAVNEIARVQIRTAKQICSETYRSNRATGSFILIDPDNNRTVAAGVLIDRRSPHSALYEGKANIHQTPRSQNIHFEQSKITQTEKETRTGCKAHTFWFTGLSASGKSTLAKLLERELFDQGTIIQRLDGDNMRHGLNADLGFTNADRSENIRRLAHVAKLFNDAGIVCIVCAISPFHMDRDYAKTVIGAERFRLIHVATPLVVCEERDPHGLYKKARAGEISGFTGISAPFETPNNADLVLDTSEIDLENCLKELNLLASCLSLDS